MEKIKFPKRFSFRILMIAVVDLLLMSISFLLNYYFAEGTFLTSQLKTPIFAMLLTYDIVFMFSIAIVSGYSKKTLSRPPTTMFLLLFSTVATHIIVFAVFKIMGIDFSFGILTCGALSFSLITISRVFQKFAFGQFVKSSNLFPKNQQKAMIIGAGFTGKMIYRELVEIGSKYEPVCFVDDNKDIISKTVCGLYVYGPCVLIPELVKKYGINLIVFAIPSASSETRDRILSYCADVNCNVSVVPSLSELTSGKEFFKQAITVDVEKLLGRDVIQLKDTSIEKFIKGKSCLVTGGGGSIGSELCRQIVKANPKIIVLVDIYENNAYDVQQELLREGYSKDNIRIEISSVRDYEKMETLFKRYNFDMVFHAAAHKHVPLMEDNPEEAVKNNVCGTYNIARLSKKYKAGKMVLISTDKAVNPTNVMGATKRVCEMVVQCMSRLPDNTTKFAIVRFGNVLGSNGSVIPLFTKQIEKGGPVTVTHRDIIRYFMTIPEAVSLVLEAASMAMGGEIFVLDMGEPVKIVTLAENLIRMYGYQPYSDIKIEFCGLRPGEKLFEELLMNEEGLKQTKNNKIFIGNPIPINIENFKNQLDTLKNTAESNDSEKTVEMLHKVVCTYKTPDEINSNAATV